MRQTYDTAFLVLKWVEKMQETMDVELVKIDTSKKLLNSIFVVNNLYIKNNNHDECNDYREYLSYIYNEIFKIWEFAYKEYKKVMKQKKWNGNLQKSNIGEKFEKLIWEINNKYSNDIVSILDVLNKTWCRFGIFQRISIYDSSIQWNFDDLVDKYYNIGSFIAVSNLFQNLIQKNKEFPNEFLQNALTTLCKKNYDVDLTDDETKYPKDFVEHKEFWKIRNWYKILRARGRVMSTKKEDTVWMCLGWGWWNAPIHFGYLKKMEEDGIYPDLLIWSSAGSIIVILYAASKKLNLSIEETFQTYYLNKASWYSNNRSGKEKIDRMNNTIREIVNKEKTTFDDLKIPLLLTACVKRKDGIKENIIFGGTDNINDSLTMSCNVFGMKTKYLWHYVYDSWFAKWNNDFLDATSTNPIEFIQKIWVSKKYFSDITWGWTTSWLHKLISDGYHIAGNPFIMWDFGYKIQERYMKGFEKSNLKPLCNVNISKNMYKVFNFVNKIVKFVKK